MKNEKIETLMINYKERSLHHIKRKTLPNFWTFEEQKGLVIMSEKGRDKFFKLFQSWKEAYEFVYSFTRSAKRSWIEEKIDCRLVIWDTDLAPLEQDCVDYMLEFFNYELGSFEMEELREVLAENRDDENLANACDILIKALIKTNKEIIEIE